MNREHVHRSSHAGSGCDICDEMMLAASARRYHVVVINERTDYKSYMTATPVTHREGCTILSKITDYPNNWNPFNGSPRTVMVRGSRR